MTDKLCSRCGSSVFVQDGDKLRTHDCQGEQAQAPKREPWIVFSRSGKEAYVYVPGSVWNYYGGEMDAPSKGVSVSLWNLDGPWNVMTVDTPEPLRRILSEAVQREAERQERATVKESLTVPASVSQADGAADAGEGSREE